MTYRHAFLCLAACLLTACATPVPDAAVASQISLGPVRMPSGIDIARLRLIDEARLMRVYTQMTGIGDAADDKRLFSSAVAGKIGLTSRQVNRRFMDMILASRRFAVFDDSTTVVRDNAVQTVDGKLMDIVIDGEVVGATQDVLVITPYRKVHTAIRMSVQLKDVISGQELFPTAVSVIGEWGLSQGEGALLAPNVSLSSAEMQASLANDYQRALDKALIAAVARINQVLRPMGRISFVDARSVNVIGGSRHGFQGGDSLVLVHIDTTTLGDRQVIARTQPLAVVRCDGVGTETSQCDLVRLDPRFTLNVGDYAVLSDRSAAGLREE